MDEARGGEERTSRLEMSQRAVQALEQRGRQAARASRHGLEVVGEGRGQHRAGHLVKGVWRSEGGCSVARVCGMVRGSSAGHLEVEIKVETARLRRLERRSSHTALAALAALRQGHGCRHGCRCPAEQGGDEARAHTEDARVHRTRLGQPARTGRQQRLQAQCLGRRFLQEACYRTRGPARPARPVRLAEDKDAVAAALLQRGGLAEAAQVAASKTSGQRRRVEVDDDVSRGEDQLAL